MKILDNLAKFMKKIRKPKFILKGSCKKCGACCRNITIMIGDNYLTDESEFERIKNFDSKYENFFISGKDENDLLLFTCKSLGENNLCADYRFRSIYCRLYPRIRTKHINANSEMIEECGFYIDSNIKFEEFLKYTARRK